MLEMYLTYKMLKHRKFFLHWEYKEYLKTHKDGEDNGYTNLKYLFQDRISNQLEVTTEIAETISQTIGGYSCNVYQITKNCKHLYIHTHKFISERGTKLGELVICRMIVSDDGSDEDTVEWYNEIVFKDKLLAAVLVYLAERILDVNGFVEISPSHTLLMTEKMKGVKVGSMMEKDGKMGLVRHIPVEVKFSHDLNKLIVKFTDQLEIE